MFDAQDVTAGFSYTPGSKTGCGAYAVSRDTLTLTPGQHSLHAGIFEASGGAGEPLDGFAMAEYTYVRTNEAPPPGDTTYGVSVSPETGTATVGTSSHPTQVFTVQNSGNQPSTFTIGFSCTGAVSSCAGTATQLTLDGGATGLVGVSYTASAAPRQTGAVKLWAVRNGTPALAGTGTVQVSTKEPQIAGTVSGVGEGTRLERGLCVTASAGAGAAFECGDLRLGHGLPATRSRNRVRAPVLLYNSQHARPYPIVALDLAPPAGPRPDTIRGVLQLSDGTVVNAWWPGWPSDTLKRISVGFDAGLREGIYSYTLTLTAKWNGGASQAIGSWPGRLVIVNRRNSEFGAGWWLAGLERIAYQTDGSLLWIGGDGSHRLYRPDPGAAGRWGTDRFLRPDSVVLRTDPDPAKTRYARILPGRGEVRFDNQGRHRETVSPRGDTTYFHYDGEGRLDLVNWSGAGGNGYDFRYAASGAPLSSVATWAASPGSERVVRVQTDASRRVTAIVDPTPDTVTFGYAAGSTSAVVTSRTDRMGATTNFTFDAGNKLWRSTFALTSPATSPDDSINIRFTPVETRGLGPFPVPTAAATVAMNGPLADQPNGADLADVWVNRWGMPVRMRAPD
ncbi:MAG TPA: hypothetical protein VFQ39_04600, partial [Longimicrobium sp.]|nr:hypothetical protein [Longimicrobium sp.]